VINSLTHSGKDIFIISLPVLLLLEEERVKRRREGQSSNILMAQNYAHTSHAPAFKGKPKKFMNLDFYNLKIWGCKAHVLIPKPLRDKLASKT
jgi:hypothetical protein